MDLFLTRDFIQTEKENKIIFSVNKIVNIRFRKHF